MHEGMSDEQIRYLERQDRAVRHEPFDEFAASRGPDGEVGQDADYLERIADARAAAAEAPEGWDG